jgi:hypothetical protein
MFSFTNYFIFITLNASLFHIKGEKLVEELMAKNMSDEVAKQIAVDFLKERKKTEKIDISTVEEKGGAWVIKGTCPIDLEGHPWAERFEVVVDQKGKIKSTDFALL